MKTRVLIVDDDASMCQMLAERLQSRGFAPSWHTSGNEALASLARRECDVVVTDLNMGGMDGIELCERVASAFPDVPVIVITAFGSMQSAIRAVRAGAYDYITKPFEIDELTMALDRATEHRFLTHEVKRLRSLVQEGDVLGLMTARCESMTRVFDLVRRVADSDASVLITGESGTGKELVARAIHSLSGRSAGPFVAINSAAVPENLLESELFGHVKGAFTDARSSRLGLLVQASGGTVFFDEIGDMPLNLQPRILRALQERCVRPLGGDAEVPFDARVVAATNRSLESDVADRRFREELYFRINVVHIALPPLRDRGNDVLILAQQFMDEFATRQDKPIRGIDPAAAARLVRYPWPGNVRELRNCMERAVTLARVDQIMPDDLPDRIRDSIPARSAPPAEEPLALCTVDELERRHIVRVLEATGRNKTEAARILGLDRKTLYRKLEQYGKHDEHR